MKLHTEPSTQQGWLDKLGKRLVWYFPSLQAREILEDCQEQFDAGRERGRAEAEMLRSMGSPAEAAARLLEEEPTARAAQLRTSVIWGIGMALCLAFLWISMVNAAYTNQLTWIGAYVFIPGGAAVLFKLLRGPERVELEERFPPERTASPVPVYYVPFILTVLFEAAEQILILLAENGRLPERINMNIGELNTWFILYVDLGLLALLAWLIFRSITVSVRYFPGVVHTVGALGTTFFSYIYCTSIQMARLPSPSLAMLLCLAPYGISLVTAAAFQRWVDRRKPLPRFFRPAAVGREDWLHQLGHSLLGWFPAEQALEVLEDYREQFELGLERGRTEEALAVSIGCPEAVVRDLVREDWKAKRYHRKYLWWAVPLAAGAWLLLELAKAFELGFGGLRWLFCVWDENWKLVSFALALTFVSAFVLIHGRGRAALEKQFPTSKKPGLWLWLLPLALTAAMSGWALWILQEPAEVYRVQPFYWQMYVVSIELSVLGMAGLLVWTLARCGSGSVWHFPAAVHIAGYIAQILCTGLFLHGMDIESAAMAETSRRFLMNLLPYGAGVLLAAGFGLVIRTAGKKR